jgi:hypothetical protein
MKNDQSKQTERTEGEWAVIHRRAYKRTHKALLEIRKIVDDVLDQLHKKPYRKPRKPSQKM